LPDANRTNATITRTTIKATSTICRGNLGIVGSLVLTGKVMKSASAATRGSDEIRNVSKEAQPGRRRGADRDGRTSS
jgi:hypothetical protein